MQAMVKVLTELGVDFDAEGHKAYKFKAEGFMPLSVETWQEDNRRMISITHYGEQNGDLMADPDVLCEYYRLNYTRQGEEKPTVELIPVHFQNDYLGVFQRARIYQENGAVLVNRKLVKELKGFLSQWAKNIKAQGFKPVEKVKA